ncbi:hypothetical protein IC229_04540 [Spirosoma sp. BT702]|uniref:DUF4369 domain-containing protein n=1 Tax=Spirosoma profusum TaxID=2771354 RepID=A0A926Y0V5_9BACT|nr:hypothetical protein [Spirosoma profusum]MBD2699890.1 hypothetical protein [Spirosoma profusum]
MYSIRLVCLFLLLTPGVWGQTIKADSSFTQIARNTAIRSYDKAMYRQIHIYEGHEYIVHDHRIKIHPYYVTDNLQTGTIFYNGVDYDKVAMLYDIVRDELVVQPPEGAYRLTLRNEKIARFTLGTHAFTRIVSDSTTGIRTGFYELLHDGKTKALAKRQKTILEDISSGVYKGEYLLNDKFYIFKDNTYREVKSKQSLLRLFPDQSKELRKYIRSNSLKFKNELREEAITKVTRRYDELTR